jgi:hypothetical protein
MFARSTLLTLAMSSMVVAEGATPPIEDAEATVFVDDRGNLVIPADMRTALETSLPGFQHWQAADYREGHRDIKADQSARGIIAPFAIVLDLNRDGREDLVIDGHDENSSILVCVVSNKTGYSANKVYGVKPKENPAAITSWEQGEIGVGLNRFFSLPEAIDENGIVFSVNHLRPTGIIGAQPPEISSLNILFVNDRCAVDDGE